MALLRVSQWPQDGLTPLGKALLWEYDTGILRALLEKINTMSDAAKTAIFVSPSRRVSNCKNAPCSLLFEINDRRSKCFDSDFLDTKALWWSDSLCFFVSNTMDTSR